MKTPILAALLLLSAPAFATPESDRIAVLESRLAALESALTKQPQPAARPSRAYVTAARALLGYRFAAFGSPIFAYPGYGGGGSSGGFSGGTVASATTFSGDVTFNGGTGALGFASGETLVPADSTLNVTGNIVATGSFYTNSFIGRSGGGDVITFTGGRIAVTPTATYGVDVQTSGSKVACDTNNQGSLFYENTDSDSTVAKVFICGEKADNSFAWGEFTVTYP